MIAIMSELVAFLQEFPHREQAFAPGQAIFRLGDAVRTMHVIHSGIVHLVRHQADGAALILQRAGAGAILAEASLYSATYHCDARAETATVTWAIERTEVRRRLVQNAAFGEAWAIHLAHEVQRARLHSEILSLKTVADRLDAWVAWHGPPTLKKGSWSLIAREIGVSPEALYREIARRRLGR